MTGCLDAETASAYLDRALPTLQRVAVDEHVSRCDPCRRMLAEVLQIYDLDDNRDSAPTRAVGFALPSKPLDVGSTVGRYMVLGVLGRGGLGIVYSAYDPELDRKVALKLVRPDQPDDDDDLEHGTRLMREAHAMAKISHPNVVTVYDVGMQHGHVFIAMELVAGSTLSQWAKLESPSWRTIRDALVAAGRGLEAAHRAGFIHRDFKPSNVLMGDDGRVRVLDFGLARALAVPAEARAGAGQDTSAAAGLLGQQLTQVGTILGTPPYMALEQFRGERGDERTDQFAFCVALYRLLYARFPFSGESMQELVANLASAEPARPPAGHPAPRWLFKSVCRGLQPDPSSRYSSMTDLLAAITVDQRRRRRGILGVVFAVAVGLSASAGWALRSTPPMVAPSVVDSLAHDAEAAAARALFVYPPADAPDAVTAFMRVVELEALEGDAMDAGRIRAAELRSQFAETLIRLGDDYWDRDGGRVFAADYYAAALLFTPQSTHAAERAFLTPAGMSALESKAQRGDFSASELVAAEPLRILADENATRRAHRIATLLEQREARSTVLTALERLATDEAPREHVEKVSNARASIDVSSSDPPVREAPIESAARTSADSAEQARASTREGEDLLRSRSFEAASRAFHRALRHKHNFAPALIGLSDVHFELGEYQQAVSFATKAVAAAPRRAGYRIKLGDAYLNVLRYDDATEHYERARALGDSRAAGRLASLARRVGK